MIVTTPHIDPWMHPSFVPLPEIVVRGLRAVNAIEMPSRHHYDDTLSKFLAGLTPELRETATFTTETYAEVARAIAEGRITSLANRLQLWATCHHARSGSAKRHLILLPRDAFYHMNREDEEKLRLNYIMQADGEENSESAKKLAENGLSPAQSAAVFERVPVQNQIYDVLVYTHRNHGSSSTMLFEARRIGVVSGSPAGIIVAPCRKPYWCLILVSLSRQRLPGRWWRCSSVFALCASFARRAARQEVPLKRSWDRIVGLPSRLLLRPSQVA